MPPRRLLVRRWGDHCGEMNRSVFCKSLGHSSVRSPGVMIEHEEDSAMPNRAATFITVLGLLVGLAGCEGNRKGTFSPAEVTLKTQGDMKELQDELLTFRDSHGVEWVAPKGTLTDGASVPRLVLPLTDDRFSREFLKAAVVHDAYCQEENKTRTPKQFHARPWKQVHRMFYEAMIADGTSEVKAKIMLAAVWLAGPRWDEAGGQRLEIPPDPLTRGFIGSKQWIEVNNPTVDQIVADMDRREPLLRDLYEREAAILDALEKNARDKASGLLREEDAILKRELEKAPKDLMLLNFKGYFHKNRAILDRMSKDEARVDEELNNSERAFKAVIEREPEDAGALNGLGSVSILRGDLDRGEEFIGKALKIVPNYVAAKHDLQLIKKLRKPNLNR